MELVRKSVFSAVGRKAFLFLWCLLFWIISGNVSAVTFISLHDSCSCLHQRTNSFSLDRKTHKRFLKENSWRLVPLPCHRIDSLFPVYQIQKHPQNNLFMKKVPETAQLGGNVSLALRANKCGFFGESNRGNEAEWLYAPARKTGRNKSVTQCSAIPCERQRPVLEKYWINIAPSKPGVWQFSSFSSSPEKYFVG